LRKDVTERYSTVTALADDIQRHLQFLPVRARGEGVSYGLRRLLRRNRALATSIAAVMPALGLGLAIALAEKNKAVREEAVARYQTSVAESETKRANELARHNEEVAQRLQQSLDKNEIQDRQLQLAVQSVVAELERINHQAESPSQAGRGEGPPPSSARDVLLGRNYGVLAQLLALSGDREGARSAYQSCVANLKRAQEAGDVSRATLEAMRRCQAGR